MATIPSGTKFIGLSPSYQTVERRSALINSESEPYTMQDITDTVSAGLPPATNPTTQYVPYNNSGVFADSPLRRDAATTTVYSNYNHTLSRTSSEGVPVYGLYNDADGFFGNVQGGSGIQWGYENADPMFGPESAKDCSIQSSPAPAGFFGSGLGILTQKNMSSSASYLDTQVVGLDVRPWNFMTATGGVKVYGGSGINFSMSYFDVQGDDGFPPFYKMDFSCARFDGAMTAIVVPKVPAANQGMMAGENGMILYNTDTNKFQGYANGVWVDLH